MKVWCHRLEMSVLFRCTDHQMIKTLHEMVGNTQQVVHDIVKKLATYNFSIIVSPQYGQLPEAVIILTSIGKISSPQQGVFARILF